MLLSVHIFYVFLHSLGQFFLLLSLVLHLKCSVLSYWPVPIFFFCSYNWISMRCTDVCGRANCQNAMDDDEEDDCNSDDESYSDMEWRVLFVCRIRTTELFLLERESVFCLYPFSSCRIKFSYWHWTVTLDSLFNNLNKHKKFF